MNNFFFFFTFFPSILLYDVVVNMSARTISVVDKTVIVEESRSVLLCVLFFFLWMSVCVNFCYVGEENQYSALAHLISFYMYTVCTICFGFRLVEYRAFVCCNKDFLE